jgi:nitrile hydratase
VSYRSHADIGGRDVDGRVVPESEDERFHAEWERGALALVLAMGATGEWSLDTSRRVRETLPHYASLGYYEIWTAALEKLLVERGLVTEDELAARRMLHPARALRSVLRASDVAAVLARGSPTERPATQPARFAVGERVRTKAADVPHHTRLPRYARGKVGVVERCHGVYVFADTNAHDLGEQPQWLYTVAFDARELWGDEALDGLTVSIDAWEPYLEPNK